MGDASYATLYLPFDVTTTGATKAYYIVTVNNGSAQLTETGNGGTEIPANTAVVLVNSDADASTVLNMATGLSSVVSESANLLKGTLVPMSLDLSDKTSYYSMGRKKDAQDVYQIGFYKFTGGTITLGANKAYLDTTASSGNVKGFLLNFGGIVDAIDTIDSSQSDNVIYDLAGRRIEKPAHGVYIKNGKKIIVK